MSDPMWQLRLVTEPPTAEEMQATPHVPAVVGTLLIGDDRLRGSLWGVIHTIRGSIPLDALHLVGPGVHHLRLYQPRTSSAETLDATVPQDHPFFTAPTTIWSRTIGALGGEAVWRRLVGLRVAVIGVGRTGSLVATTLTRLGLQTLTLIDPDVVEAHNIGEMDGVTQYDVGGSKVVALAAVLAQHTATHLIALPLPITAETARAACQQADVPTDFATRLVSVELLAALTAWAMAIPADCRTPEHVRFALSCVLSVARLPWLWDVGHREELATQLARLLAHTSNLGGSYEDTLDNVQQYWRRVMRRGHAFRRLEHALAGRTPVDLRTHIRQAHIDAGELLWQGTRGFCVATTRCGRSPNEKVPVLCLQGTSEEIQFRADFAIPLRALLQTDITPTTDTFGSEQRREILFLIEELQRGLYSN